jgi:hypothetical protein
LFALLSDCIPDYPQKGSYVNYKIQWLSKPVYEMLPYVFLLAAIAFLQITDNVFVTLFAIYLFGYSLYIFAWRLMARDSILIG